MTSNQWQALFHTPVTNNKEMLFLDVYAIWLSIGHYSQPLGKV